MNDGPLIEPRDGWIRAHQPQGIMLRIDVKPKQLREALCEAQSLMTTRKHVEFFQKLIDECDRHRPLGPDGKHGDLHTQTCGCE